jgi:hypothetical protein
MDVPLERGRAWSTYLHIHNTRHLSSLPPFCIYFPDICGSIINYWVASYDKYIYTSNGFALTLTNAPFSQVPLSIIGSDFFCSVHSQINISKVTSNVSRLVRFDVLKAVLLRIGT